MGTTVRPLVKCHSASASRFAVIASSESESESSASASSAVSRRRCTWSPRAGVPPASRPWLWAISARRLGTTPTTPYKGVTALHVGALPMPPPARRVACARIVGVRRTRRAARRARRRRVRAFLGRGRASPCQRRWSSAFTPRRSASSWATRPRAARQMRPSTAQHRHFKDQEPTCTASDHLRVPLRLRRGVVWDRPHRTVYGPSPSDDGGRRIPSRGRTGPLKGPSTGPSRGRFGPSRSRIGSSPWMSRYRPRGRLRGRIEAAYAWDGRNPRQTVRVFHTSPTRVFRARRHALAEMPTLL
ncbi:hypothetical protein M885DRAFT_335367 [Pelagophyceae sp. CCMP2097]|nr:hypothetical protein M885DRAFT_335367 [Pelagophyceae sp. CCMP2097]